MGVNIKCACGDELSVTFLVDCDLDGEGTVEICNNCASLAVQEFKDGDMWDEVGEWIDADPEQRIIDYGQLQAVLDEHLQVAKEEQAMEFAAMIADRYILTPKE